jgi:WD40 repeat protein
VNEGEPVYDFCWYPYMSMSGEWIASFVMLLGGVCKLSIFGECKVLCCFADPATCVFASTSRDHPIHLWDAATGEVDF